MQEHNRNAQIDEPVSCQVAHRRGKSAGRVLQAVSCTLYCVRAHHLVYGNDGAHRHAQQQKEACRPDALQAVHHPCVHWGFRLISNVFTALQNVAQASDCTGALSYAGLCPDLCARSTSKSALPAAMCSTSGGLGPLFQLFEAISHLLCCAVMGWLTCCGAWPRCATVI